MLETILNWMVLLRQKTPAQTDVFIFTINFSAVELSFTVIWAIRREYFCSIFVCIWRCDVVARGIIMAAESTNHQMPPMVVRMLGTNADEGLNILKESSLSVTLVNDLKQAASEIKQMV